MPLKISESLAELDALRRRAEQVCEESRALLLAQRLTLENVRAQMVRIRKTRMEVSEALKRH